MSLIILLLLSFGSKSNLALPIIDLTGRSESSLATAPDGPSQRSLFTIVWGCFSTTFVCAWVSVHPNIPPPEECGWRSLWDRFQLMIWMVIAPELILAWAGRQWFAAKKIADVYNGAKYPGLKKPGRLAKIGNFIRQWLLGRKDMPDSVLWSRAHGHFVSMGGVVLVEPAANTATVDPKLSEKAVVTHVDSPSSSRLKTSEATPTEHILSLELLEQLVNRPDFRILITEEDIRDKSKRDLLSKLIVIIQSSWFIAQCITRGANDLKITELELVTLAVASLNAVMYFFWWDKPLDVKVPIKVYLNFRLDDSPQTAQDNLYFPEPSAQADDAVSTLTSILSPTDVQSRSSAVFLRLSGLVLDILKKPFEGGFLNSLYRWFILLPFYVLALVFFPFFFPFPFVIVFLIRFITPKPKPQLSSENRGVLLTQIVGELRTTRSQLTYFIDGAFDAWLNSISDVQGSLLSFLFGWFFVLPTFVITLAILLLFVPVFAFFFLVFFVFTTMFTIFASSTVHPGDTHVHRFYSPKTDSDRYSRMVIFAFFGVIFGGLHCLAWHFIYPTQQERTLWRLTAMTITVIPIIVAPIDYITNASGGDPSDPDGSNDAVEDNLSVTNHGPASFIFSLDQTWKRRLVKKVLIYTLDFIMTVLLFVYVLARLSLIAQALALLRRQPPTAFLAVDWTQYIPHV